MQEYKKQLKTEKHYLELIWNKQQKNKLWQTSKTLSCFCGKRSHVLFKRVTDVLSSPLLKKKKEKLTRLESIFIIVSYRWRCFRNL